MFLRCPGAKPMKQAPPLVTQLYEYNEDLIWYIFSWPSAIFRAFVDSFIRLVISDNNREAGNAYFLPQALYFASTNRMRKHSCSVRVCEILNVSSQLIKVHSQRNFAYDVTYCFSVQANKLRNCWQCARTILALPLWCHNVYCDINERWKYRWRCRRSGVHFPG